MQVVLVGVSAATVFKLQLVHIYFLYYVFNISGEKIEVEP